MPYLLFMLPGGGGDKKKIRSNMEAISSLFAGPVLGQHFSNSFLKSTNEKKHSGRTRFCEARYHKDMLRHETGCNTKQQEPDEYMMTGTGIFHTIRK